MSNHEPIVTLGDGTFRPAVLLDGVRVGRLGLRTGRRVLALSATLDLIQLRVIVAFLEKAEETP